MKDGIGETKFYLQQLEYSIEIAKGEGQVSDEEYRNFKEKLKDLQQTLKV